MLTSHPMVGSDLQVVSTSPSFGTVGLIHLWKLSCFVICNGRDKTLNSAVVWTNDLAFLYIYMLTDYKNILGALV